MTGKQIIAIALVVMLVAMDTASAEEDDEQERPFIEIPTEPPDTYMSNHGHYGMSQQPYRQRVSSTGANDPYPKPSAKRTSYAARRPVVAPQGSRADFHYQAAPFYENVGQETQYKQSRNRDSLSNRSSPGARNRPRPGSRATPEVEPPLGSRTRAGTTRDAGAQFKSEVRKGARASNNVRSGTGSQQQIASIGPTWPKQIKSGSIQNRANVGGYVPYWKNKHGYFTNRRNSAAMLSLAKRRNRYIATQRRRYHVNGSGGSLRTRGRMSAGRTMRQQRNDNQGVRGKGNTERTLFKGRKRY